MYSSNGAAERDSFFSDTRRAPRTCAKVAPFRSIIISVDDYRKGQRPPQFLIIDRTTVKSFFCRRALGRLSRVERTWHILRVRRKRERNRQTEREREREVSRVRSRGTKETKESRMESQVSPRDFLYIAITAARSSVDRSGNKFDKSICSTATTRSSHGECLREAASCLRESVLTPRAYATRRRRTVVGFLRMI